MGDFVSWVWGFFASPVRFWVFIMLVLLSIVVAIVVKGWMDRHFTHFRHILDIDTKRYRFLKHFLMGLVFLICCGLAIYLIPSLRALSVSIFAGAGVLAIILGFAAQHALANVISGVFLAVFKPFRVGDWIKMEEGVDGEYGVVEDITLRHTIIRTPKNKRIIVPNSVMGDRVIQNSSIDDPKVCEYIEMDISYDSDIDKALKIMQAECASHADSMDIRTERDKDNGVPRIRAKVTGFGDSSVKLRAWVWAKDPFVGFQMRWDLYKMIKQRFDREGIEIPFPYRTVVYKKDMKKSRRKK